MKQLLYVLCGVALCLPCKKFTEKAQASMTCFEANKMDSLHRARIHELNKQEAAGCIMMGMASGW